MMRTASVNMASNTAKRVANLSDRLSSPELRSLVERFVRRRVPEVEVDDVVQTVFVHALASSSAPDEDEALRKWLVGITRHKVADFHRKGGRVKLVELSEHASDGAGDGHEARELADWAQKQTEGPDSKRTLDWMVREGDGEKLAHIAEEEQLPPTQVRQRVSRMRRMMKQRWAAELAAVAAIVVLALVAWRFLRAPEPIAQPDVIPDVVPAPSVDAPLKRAELLRDEAEAACDRGAFQECLDRVNEAAELDPRGDRASRASGLRQRAEKALAPPPAPSVTQAPSATPPTTARPVVPSPSKPSDLKLSPTPTPGPPPPKPTPKTDPKKGKIDFGKPKSNDTPPQPVQVPKNPGSSSTPGSSISF